MNFLSPQQVQTGCEAHLDPYSMGTGHALPGVKAAGCSVKLTFRVQLVPTLKIYYTSTPQYNFIEGRGTTLRNFVGLWHSTDTRRIQIGYTGKE
jgi:hypothetical protein